MTVEYAYEEYDEENTFTIREDEEAYIINNAHDKLYRSLLSNKSEAVNLINDVFNLTEENKLKEEDIYLYPTNYVTKEYKNKIADIVYEVTNDKIQKGSLYILIEHQSSVDKKMLSRIIEYTFEITYRAMNEARAENRKVIPIVKPIVLYTGDRKWNAITNINEVYKSIEGFEQVFGKYELIEAMNLHTEKQIKKPGALPKIMAMEKAKTREELYETIDKINFNELTEAQREECSNFIDKIIRQEYGKTICDEIIKKIEKGGDREMTLPERLHAQHVRELRESRNDGLTEGRSEGKVIGFNEGRREIAKRLIAMGMSDKDIKKATHLTEEEIEALK